MENFQNHQPEFEEWQEQPWLNKISLLAEGAAKTVFVYLFEVAYLPTEHRRRYRFLLFGAFLRSARDEYKKDEFIQKINFSSFEELLPFIASQMKQMYGGLKYQQPYPTVDNPDLIQIIDFFLTGEIASQVYLILKLKKTFENYSMPGLKTIDEAFETRAAQVFQKSFFTCLFILANKDCRKTLDQMLLDSDKRAWVTKEDRLLWEPEILKRKKELEEANKRDDQV